MGRKRTKEPDPNRKVVIFNIKGTAEWRAWLDRTSVHCRLPVSSLIDLAVAQYAETQGFTEKPPVR